MDGRQSVGRRGVHWLPGGRWCHRGLCETRREKTDVGRYNLQSMMQSDRKRLGELLVDWGLLTRAQLDEALAIQQNDRRRLGVVLIERGYLSATKLTQLLSHQFGLPFVSLARVQYTPELVAFVPGRLAHRLRVVPICTSGEDVLFVATDDPTQAELVERVGDACRREIRLMVAAPDEVQAVIDQHYGDVDTELPPHASQLPPLPTLPKTPLEPTGAVRIALVHELPPPSLRDSGAHEAPINPSAIVELSSADLQEIEDEEAVPAVMVISPDPAFEAQCETAARAQGLTLVKASLVSATQTAAQKRPIAIVLKEKTFAFDRIAFTKLGMQSGAHLVIWSDELDESYLQALFASARSSAMHGPHK